jgi:hypothetical protein
MSDFESPSQLTSSELPQDPIFQQQVQRLYQITLYSRWVIVALLWLVITPFCLWGLRDEIPLWFDYFTWTAVRYSLIYNPLSALGLALCFGATLAVLLWQGCNVLFGVSPDYKRQLEKQLFKIRQQGKSHPLWKWVCEPETHNLPM